MIVRVVIVAESHGETVEVTREASISSAHIPAMAVAAARKTVAALEVRP